MDPKIKCSRCDREATYDSPELLCDLHWAEWWAEDDDDPENPNPLSHKQRKKYKKEVLRFIKRKKE
jgi:hypothetical protein